VKRDVRKDPRAGDFVNWRAAGERHEVRVERIDDRGVVFYFEDGVERITTLTVWPKLAARWRSESR
jgi:hypothetical protein